MLTEPSPPADPSRPLTTGSARDRRDEIGQLHMRGRLDRTLPAVLAALDDPANAGPKYASVRGQIGWTLCSSADDPLVRRTLVRLLREDVDRVADKVAQRAWASDALMSDLVAALPDACHSDRRWAQRIMAAVRYAEVTLPPEIAARLAEAGIRGSTGD